MILGQELTTQNYEKVVHNFNNEVIGLDDGFILSAT
jgi:hypothetical protein